MDDLSALSLAPGSVGVLDPDAFDPGEISGMRSAAWILLGTAAVGLLAWTTMPGPPVVGIVDLFLGVQLLRLRHSWRAWVLLRAWVGFALAIIICLSAIAGSSGWAAGTSALMGLAQAAYAGSLLLLLHGAPTMKRVTLGRLVFGVSIVLIIVALLFSALSAPPMA